MKRKSSPRAQWSTLLCAELRARLAHLVQRMRSPADGGGELPFRGLVIGDAEVDRLLGAAGAGEPQFEAGSLWRVLAAASAPRAAHLQQAFRLSDFELECVLACLAPELDRELERIYAYLNDDVTQRQPSIDLLLRLLAPPAARLQLAGALARDARLLRHSILVPLDPAAGSRHAHGAFARVADGVARFLLGQDGEEPLLARARCVVDAAPLAPVLWSKLPLITELGGLLQDHAAARGRAPLIAVLRGRAGSGRRFAAETACERVGHGCIALDLARLRRSPEAERTLVAAFRDSVLRGAPLLLHHLDAWLDDAERAAELRAWLQPLVHELGWAVFFGCESGASLSNWFRGARVVEFELPELTVAARAEAWQALLPVHAKLVGEEAEAIADTLAAKFRLSHGEIAETLARAAGARELPGEASAWSKLLHQQAARVAAPRLGQLAQPVRATHGFEDLVLPQDKLDSLREIVRRVRHRRTVMEQWGFGELSSRGRGLVALFFGPSGTGKTMAAEVVAHELDMQLFRIDLAGVVSKYIGETEKNLRAVFEEADRADAVLFFDEADALFGKRSEVKDAHDRYANIEIDYLLQRIESFEGVAILATNMRGHLDPAFLRRIHVTVEFTLPQAAERLGLWQRSFPAAAPRSVDVDWDFLAGRFELSGGAIRSAAFGAAYLAAEGARAIGMAEIVKALHGELAKAGRRVAATDFGRYAHHVQQHRPSP
jgi:hypothetical protein